MKRFMIHSIVIALLLASASFAFPQQRVSKSYTGTYNGAACTVQMTWHDWAGWGPVDGRIRLANGTTIPFSGSNPQAGVLDLTVNGTPIRLVRRGTGRSPRGRARPCPSPRARRRRRPARALHRRPRPRSREEKRPSSTGPIPERGKGSRSRRKCVGRRATPRTSCAAESGR